MRVDPDRSRPATETAAPRSHAGMPRSSLRHAAQPTFLLCIVIIAAHLLAPAAGAYEHRRGTPSVGLELQYGGIEGDSDWGDGFDYGLGVAVRLRQYMARNQAIGLSFELQRFEASGALEVTDSAFSPDRFQAQILMFDYYLYLNRPKRMTQYFVASAGFYRPELLDEFEDESGAEGEQVEHPGENLLARLGVGGEYFVARTFSIDGCASLYYWNAPDVDGLTISGQIAVGIHLYAGR